MLEMSTGDEKPWKEVVAKVEVILGSNDADAKQWSHAATQEVIKRFKYIGDLHSYVYLEHALRASVACFSPEDWKEFKEAAGSPTLPTTASQCLASILSQKSEKGYVFSNAGYKTLASVVRPEYIPNRTARQLLLELALCSHEMEGGVRTELKNELEQMWSGTATLGY